MKSETHLIDCVEFMRGLPDKAYSLALVDPPYGLGESVVNSGGRFKRYKNKNGNWDMNIPTDKYFDELFRVSENQIVWGGNYFPLPQTKCFIIWDKVQPEGISFAMAEYAWASFNKGSQIYRQRPQGQDQRFHPTAKPIELYRWLLRNYAKPGDTIFDSHMGSQSSRIACHMEGYDFTGCELDPEYFEQGNARYETFLKTYGTPDPEKAIPGQQINMF